MTRWLNKLMSIILAALILFLAAGNTVKAFGDDIAYEAVFFDVKGYTQDEIYRTYKDQLDGKTVSVIMDGSDLGAVNFLRMFDISSLDLYIDYADEESFEHSSMDTSLLFPDNVRSVTVTCKGNPVYSDSEAGMNFYASLWVCCPDALVNDVPVSDIVKSLKAEDEYGTMSIFDGFAKLHYIFELAENGELELIEGDPVYDGKLIFLVIDDQEMSSQECVIFEEKFFGISSSRLASEFDEADTAVIIYPVRTLIGRYSNGGEAISTFTKVCVIDLNTLGMYETYTAVRNDPPETLPVTVEDGRYSSDGAEGEYDPAAAVSQIAEALSKQESKETANKENDKQAADTKSKEAGTPSTVLSGSGSVTANNSTEEDEKINILPWKRLAVDEKEPETGSVKETMAVADEEPATASDEEPTTAEADEGATTAAADEGTTTAAADEGTTTVAADEEPTTAKTDEATTSIAQRRMGSVTLSEPATVSRKADSEPVAETSTESEAAASTEGTTGSEAPSTEATTEAAADPETAAAEATTKAATDSETAAAEAAAGSEKTSIEPTTEKETAAELVYIDSSVYKWLTNDKLYEIFDALGDEKYKKLYESLKTVKDLQAGSKGELALILQQTLVAFGRNIKEDSNIGAATIAALNEVQEAFGLVSTSKVSSKTYALLMPALLVYTNEDAAKNLFGNLTGKGGSQFTYMKAGALYLDEHYYKAKETYESCEYADSKERALKCIQEMPSTGLYYQNSNLKNTSVKLTVVVNSPDPSAVTCIKVYSDKAELCACLIIRDTGEASVSLPEGDYKILSGTGYRWYGMGDMFGNEGKYESMIFDEGTDTVTFRKGYDYTITFNVLEHEETAVHMGSEPVAWEDIAGGDD